MEKLPKWVISNEESVWQETRHSREMTPAERWAKTIAACEILKFYWNIPGYPQRIREAQDPLPRSSVEAFARLREEYRKALR
jgi:hypothetical protein